jgi:hypothetical protein
MVQGVSALQEGTLTKQRICKLALYSQFYLIHNLYSALCSFLLKPLFNPCMLIFILSPNIAHFTVEAFTHTLIESVIIFMFSTFARQKCLNDLVHRTILPR